MKLLSMDISCCDDCPLNTYEGAFCDHDDFPEDFNSWDNLPECFVPTEGVHHLCPLPDKEATQ